MSSNGLSTEEQIRQLQKPDRFLGGLSRVPLYIFLAICGLIISVTCRFGYLYFQLYYQEQPKALITLSHWHFISFNKICLRKVHLTNATFYDAQFKEADFSGSYMWNTVFVNVNLYGAKLNKVDLRKAGLLHVDLSQADLSGANLKSTYLMEVKVSAKQLSKCFSIENIKGLPKSTLEEIKKLNPKLVEWWNGGEWDEENFTYIAE